MNHKRLVLVSAVALAVAGCAPSTRNVATVNGKAITREDLAGRLIESPVGKNALKDLILERLILQEAENKGIKVTDEQVNQFIQLQKDQLPPGRFEERYLKDTPESAIRQEARKQIALRSIALKGVPISQDSVQKFYDDNIDRFTKPQWKQAGILITDDKTSAQKAAKLLAENKDYALVFGELASSMAKSAGPQRDWFAITKDYVLNERGQPINMPAITDAIRKTGADNVSPVISLAPSPQYAVIKVFADVPSAKIELASVQPLIEYEIASRNKQVQPVEEIIQKLAKDAKLEIKIPQFADLAKPEVLAPTPNQAQQRPAPDVPRPE